MGLAPQVTNTGTQNQSARYDTRKTWKASNGMYTDGTYFYREQGPSVLAENRPDVFVPGLKAANDNAEGGGAARGGGSYGIPGAAQIAQAALMAKTRYQQRVADINNRRKSTFLTSGYKGDINPETGLVSGLKVDPFNQYGQFQLLNRAQALEGQQVDAANLERGLGSAAKGGLAAQNLGTARFGWGQQDASFGQGLVAQLGSYDAEQQGAKYDYDQALWQAEQLAAQQAIDGGDYYPWDGDPGSSDGGEDPNSYFFGATKGNFSSIDKYINKQAAKKAGAKPKTIWGGQTVIQNRGGPKPAPKPAAKPYTGNPGVRGTAGKKPILPKKGR